MTSDSLASSLLTPHSQTAHHFRNTRFPQESIAPSSTKHTPKHTHAMKPSALLTTTALAHALPSPTAAPVTLARPLNWLAGHALFPGQLLEGFGEPYENYTMQTWALHVLGKCREKTECNSTVSFAGALSLVVWERGADF